MSSTFGRLKSAAQHSDEVDHVARIGLLAYGVVHVLIGWLAVQLAIGQNSGSPSSDGAIRELAQKPFGMFAVGAVAVGMILLALWQGIEAGLGHLDKEGKQRIWKRVVSAGRVLIYLTIGVNALRLLIGSGSSGGGGTKTFTAKVLDMPGGQILVAGVGLGLLIAGGMLLRKAIGDRFKKDLESSGSSGADGAAYVWLGRIGYTAKGVALGLVGVLFAYAALTREADETGGLDQGLRTLLEQPFGSPLTIVIGLGFASFGLFCFAWSRHLSR